MIQVKDVIEYTWNQTVGFINILDMRKQKRVEKKFEVIETIAVPSCKVLISTERLERAWSIYKRNKV